LMTTHLAPLEEYLDNTSEPIKGGHI